MVPTSDFSLGSADFEDVPQPPTAFRGFRFVFPDTPVATASVDIGHVGVGFELFLRGELTVSARVRRSPVDQRAVRACTLKALRAMAKGMMVSGIGSYAPTIKCPGLGFVQSGYRFRAPGTMAFSGACTINVAQRCDCGTVGVVGAVEYALELTATPAGRAIEAEPAQESAWFLRHEQELASIGVVVLVAVPIAPGQLVSR